MDKAKWKDTLYIAKDIPLRYEVEKQIRKASGRRELCCIDPDCTAPILKYCHGEKKKPYFAHISRSLCEYEEFERENTSAISGVKTKLFDIIKSKGFDVQLDVKLIPHHYTHLMVEDDKCRLAIELVNRNITANRIDFLYSEYKKNNIEVKWVVVNDIETFTTESDLSFVKRFIINETTKNDVLEIDVNGETVCQYILDTNKYEYKGLEIASQNYPQIYLLKNNIRMLTIEKHNLTLEGFFDKYNNWLEYKRNAFNRKIEKIVQEEKAFLERQKELEKLRKIQEEHNKKIENELQNNKQIMFEKESKNNDSKITNEKIISIKTTTSHKKGQIEKKDDAYYLKEIEEKILGGNEKVLDSLGRRWLKCRACKRIMQKPAFALLGGPGEYNMGTCWSCHNSKFY